MRILSALRYEMDPRHDLDNLVFRETEVDMWTFEEHDFVWSNLKEIVKYIPKHMVRGGVYGGGLGTVISTPALTYFLHAPLEDAAAVGMLIGGYFGSLIDAGQYIVRVIWYIYNNENLT